MSSPTVFISSTSEDLKPYRSAAREAALSAGFAVDMMEYFPAAGHPPLAACLAKVEAADVVVAIVAHRYGWVPDDADAKSITWRECERAKEVLAFVAVDEWPALLTESYRLTEADQRDECTSELIAEVRRNRAKLKEFKQWLDQRGIRATFANPDDLARKVEGALREWRERHPEFTRTVPARGSNDPSAYLRYLREQTAWIDIRGLQVGTGKAYRFPIEDLYIPLTTLTHTASIDLEHALEHKRLGIVGDPGAGKTTFLRHLAYLWCCGIADTRTDSLPFPIFIRVADLIGHIEHYAGAPQRPAAKESPAWIADFLNARNEELNWGLRSDFFREKLAGGSCVLLLDGLDEAPRREERESVARLFEQATDAFRECQFVVTTRPLAFTGESILAGFETVQIEPLQTAAIEKFLEHWCDAIAGKQYLSELTEALRERVEIRRMARNPVMLTALAVVHWNERRLPEQRADLYESILTWLARARQKRPGRATPERCLERLQRLALAMQDHPNGRAVQVEKGWAADVLGEGGLAFLEEEELDSGIAVSRGTEVRFWHLTFQEYLAARSIAGMPDSSQHALLLEGDRIYKPEWREVVLLLAGVLIRQGRGKVDGLFAAVLEHVEGGTRQLARCAGLLGSIVRDLHPLAFEPSDPEYRVLLEGVMSIFDADVAERMLLEERIDAAEALGRAGDPRLAQDNWITIDNSFQVGRYPVTVQEYRRFVDADGYAERRWWRRGGFGEWPNPKRWEEQTLHPNRPVRVQWYEASAYCEWAGLRLLSDAEWSRVRRGPIQKRSRGWMPVGLLPAEASPEGVMDLHLDIWCHEPFRDWRVSSTVFRVARDLTPPQKKP
jgi:hypothetical protein